MAAKKPASTGRPSAAKRTRAAKPASLAADLVGSCTIHIHDAPSPPPDGDHPLRCRVTFSADRSRVELTDFEPIRTTEYAAKLGPLNVTNSTAVHLRSSAHGTLSRDGHFAIDVVLFFDHAFDAPFYEEDSDLPITLSTKSGGRPLSSDGRVTLAGEGRFKGGALDGCRCRIVYEARVDPMPW
jgi:hypothetical protein